MNLATIFLISLLFVITLNPTPLTVTSNVIEVPGDYPTMQLAIDKASPGDIIKVSSGTYFESLQITKPLSLIGEGPDNTIIVGNGTVVLVNADNVEIRGFTIKNGTYGIFLWYSSGALIINNVMSSNKWNFGVWGETISHFVHDVESSNIADGKPVYFWINENDKNVPKDAGYVALVNSTNIYVEDLSLTSNEQGVLLVNTNSSFIRNVTMSGNDEGIVLRRSSSNIVVMNNLLSINWHAIYLVSSYSNALTENTIRNGTYGILAQNSSENVIYHNNFIDNKKQLFEVMSSNKWDNSKEGNYWSDYTGTDSNGDGIGDTLLPHLEVDYYPLINIFDKTLPISEAGGNQTVFTNTSVFFNASGSSDNIGIIGYNWDFGDGSDDTGVIATHIYAVAGVYTVTLTVKDASGNTAADVTIITVIDRPEVFSWQVFFVVCGTGAIIMVAFFWLRKHIETKRIKDKR